MKKLKIAGYQGDGSVHTRSVKFFIDKIQEYKLPLVPVCSKSGGLHLFLFLCFDFLIILFF